MQWNQLLDQAGKPVILRGVNVPGYEWDSEGDHNLQSIRTAIDEWHANAIRLPVSQDRWFGKGPEQVDGGKAYRALIDAAVLEASTRGAYIFVDLHWNDQAEWGKNIGQHSMPDDYSVIFWKDAAAHFKNQPAVLFDLYNEPHDVSWDIWQNGGTVTDRPNRQDMVAKTYHSPGMQKLLDVVRATGAKNVVLAGGLDWAADLSGVSAHHLNDPRGNGVIYAQHQYPWKGTLEHWEEQVSAVAAQYPVIISEFGCTPHDFKDSVAEATAWEDQVLRTALKHQWNFTAWSYHPTAGPSLVADWRYNPTEFNGVPVKTALTTGALPAAPTASAATR